MIYSTLLCVFTLRPLKGYTDLFTEAFVLVMKNEDSCEIRTSKLPVYSRATDCLGTSIATVWYETQSSTVKPHLFFIFYLECLVQAVNTGG